MDHHAIIHFIVVIEPIDTVASVVYVVMEPTEFIHYFNVKYVLEFSYLS